jgi:hypothetical protein
MARRSKNGSARSEGDEAMPALAAGGIELERHAAASRQTTELAQEFVARHATSIAGEAAGVKPSRAPSRSARDE